jgi:hypothetical protein
MDRKLVTIGDYQFLDFDPYGEYGPAPPGARVKRSGGYIYLKLWTDDPLYEYSNSGWMAEHTYVCALKLGRPLVKGESVHHKNGIRDDNHPDNLEVWSRSQPAGQRVSEKAHCPTCRCRTT